MVVLRAVLVLAGTIGCCPAFADPLDVDYLASTCTACHMPGATGAIPALAGRSPTDLAAALTAFRDGTRSDPVMTAATTGLDDATLAALADHFAGRR